MKEIIVDSAKHGKKIILVDDCHFEMLSKYTWCIIKKPNKGSELFYAVSNTKKINGTTQHRMHRLIMGVTDPKVLVDHVNCNGLDNREANLRVANSAQNSMNRRAFGESKYLGVCVSKHKSKLKDGTVRIHKYYKATIGVNGKTINLGNFPNEEMAARAYDEAAIIYNKEFARLNFPTYAEAV